ncbi:MAG: prenyltransferase [Acidimicrobiaceae bacterium]|nr:prenyltransferase [Acidimicrobiaceae bacterium]
MPPVELTQIIDYVKVRQTAESIAEWQHSSGMIPWFPGGHADPWNHIEAAMALDVAGLYDEALNAYQWLADIQLKDGSWHNYYIENGVEQDKIDTNCVAYIATGVLHHYLISKDKGFLEAMWTVVEPAIEFVLDLQTPRGEIIWACHSDGTPWSYALLTGSSSISHSLRAALAITEHLGIERPEWTTKGQRLVEVIKNNPEAFAPKHRWAMDWYYPVLTGVLQDSEGLKRLSEQTTEFEIPQKGIRCVSDRPWITTAETCECAIAYLAVGERDHGIELFTRIQDYRDENGRYLTGVVYPENVAFPEDEYSTYSAAAVILTADALLGLTDAKEIFANHSFLPALI